MSNPRVLVLGGNGMLGHRLCSDLSEGLEVVTSVRRRLESARALRAQARCRVVEGVEATDAPRIDALLAEVQPDVVINCIGVIKQRATAHDAIACIEVNALFPHLLARACESVGARLIHFSTDCVFSGTRGPYPESANPDPVDLYGRAKLLGEVGGTALTLRTSLIGLELSGGLGLVEWFLAQRGKRVRGFRHALYTGFTTAALAGIVRRVVLAPSFTGVWQVAGAEIDKYALLVAIKEAAQLDITVEPDDDFHCDRRLIADRFWAALGEQPPSWESMVAELAHEIQARDREGSS